ncbi:hypothetical protein COLO4_24565 [Corchorus olitorius]|uniref:Uncharacterized protein n=1 Tax=Corchorus olitorius TaxID=93759 RepID=A0A1R3I948_9ROSI|nr:hypothetical protein COLO4_24565 [Corchorus olitorius]
MVNDNIDHTILDAASPIQVSIAYLVNFKDKCIHLCLTSLPLVTVQKSQTSPQAKSKATKVVEDLSDTDSLPYSPPPGTLQPIAATNGETNQNMAQDLVNLSLSPSVFLFDENAPLGNMDAILADSQPGDNILTDSWNDLNSGSPLTTAFLDRLDVPGSECNLSSSMAPTVPSLNDITHNKKTSNSAQEIANATLPSNDQPSTCQQVNPPSKSTPAAANETFGLNATQVVSAAPSQVTVSAFPADLANAHLASRCNFLKTFISKALPSDDDFITVNASNAPFIADLSETFEELQTFLVNVDSVVLGNQKQLDKIYDHALSWSRAANISLRAGQFWRNFPRKFSQFLDRYNQIQDEYNRVNAKYRSFRDEQLDLNAKAKSACKFTPRSTREINLLKELDEHLVKVAALRAELDELAKQREAPTSAECDHIMEAAEKLSKSSDEFRKNLAEKDYLDILLHGMEEEFKSWRNYLPNSLKESEDEEE